MYDEDGKRSWSCELNSYGRVRSYEGQSKTDCPFRYQGQYEDAETGLYYNRFRYYDPSLGVYLSQDPIGLEGNNPTLYGYVKDTNLWVDILGLTVEGRSTDIVMSTGADANATMSGHNPPYKPNAKVTEFTTTREEIFVRVHGADNKGGSWVMHESAIRGMTPEQIKAKYSLPSTPTHVSTVVVPAGTRMRSGKVNPLVEFGGIDMNAKQFQLLQRIPDENFKNTKKLSCH
jgi:RHS repeat-associated protein